METLCIMCGKETEKDGYTARIEQHTLRPLCDECQRLCSTYPGQVLREYPSLFVPSAASKEFDMWQCANCGNENRHDRTFCWSCSTVKSASTPPAKTSSFASSVIEQQRSIEPSETGTPLIADETRSAQPESRRRLVDRYLDLYRAARLLVGLGNTVKVVGISAGAGILLLFTLVGMVASSQSGVAFFAMFVVGAVFGVLVGGIIFLLGILISAQGQILMAQADAAVHTSPFMTEAEKLNAMSLPS